MRLFIEPGLSKIEIYQLHHRLHILGTGCPAESFREISQAQLQGDVFTGQHLLQPHGIKITYTVHLDQCC